jgi:hypothetical protein
MVFCARNVPTLSATFVGLVSSLLVGAPATLDRAAVLRAQGAPAAGQLLAAGDWSQLKKSKPASKPASEPKPAQPASTPAAESATDPADEPASKPSTPRAPRVIPESEATPEDEDLVQEDRRPKIKASAKGKRRKSPDGSGDDAGDEDEDDEDTGDVIRPRIVTLHWGLGAVGRSFAYDAPLQSENSIARPAFALAVESFPATPLEGFVARLGIGAAFARELGNSKLVGDNGVTRLLPITEQRWWLEARLALPIGDSFLLVPAVGYGQTRYATAKKTVTAPSACPSNSNQICITDVNLSQFRLGVEGRIALSSTWSMKAVATFLPVISAGSGMGEIGSESKLRTLGFSVDFAVGYHFTEWFSLRGGLNFTRYSHMFSGGMIPYTSASEMYYGVIVGPAITTPW